MDLSNPLGGDNGLIFTMPYTCGVKDVTTGYDNATAVICSSAP
jgi:hypothetical protein